VIVAYLRVTIKRVKLQFEDSRMHAGPKILQNSYYTHTRRRRFDAEGVEGVRWGVGRAGVGWEWGVERRCPLPTEGWVWGGGCVPSQENFGILHLQWRNLMLSEWHFCQLMLVGCSDCNTRFAGQARAGRLIKILTHYVSHIMRSNVIHSIEMSPAVTSVKVESKLKREHRCVPTHNRFLENLTFDQKSASVTHRAVKLVCVTKFTHSRTWSKFHRYLLVIYRLSFALPL